METSLQTQQQKMSSRLKGYALVCILVVMGCGHESLALAPMVLPHETDASQGLELLPSLPVVCSPEKPTVVFPDNTLHVRAWATSTQQRPLQYTWTSTAGSIEGQGPEARWDLTDIPPGAYRANVQLRDPTGLTAACSVQVVILEGERRGQAPRETGRSFLVKGTTEVEGYGLYSYLLLGSRPTPSTRQRYLQAIETYIGLIEAVASLEDYWPRSKLNITYLPIEIPPEAGVSSDWVLEHYDYARARVLLDVIPGPHREGPYLVSSLRLLSAAANSSGPYLFQDLSTVPTPPQDLLAWWIREFLNQAAQERFWEPRTAQQLALKLRTTISILAAGLPDVQKGLESWIFWRH